MTTIIIDYSKEEHRDIILQQVESNKLACVRYDSINRITIPHCLNKGKTGGLNALAFVVKATIPLVSVRKVDGKSTL